MLLNSSETLLSIVRGKGSLKIDSILWGHCLSPIYENPVATEADLVARTESACVYIFINTPGAFERVRGKHCGSLQGLK
jgi:hypothetical protein